LRFSLLVLFSERLALNVETVIPVVSISPRRGTPGTGNIEGSSRGWHAWVSCDRVESSRPPPSAALLRFSVGPVGNIFLRGPGLPPQACTWNDRVGVRQVRNFLIRISLSVWPALVLTCAALSRDLAPLPLLWASFGFSQRTLLRALVVTQGPRTAEPTLFLVCLSFCLSPDWLHTRPPHQASTPG
jgi:hypothetical protein